MNKGVLPPSEMAALAHGIGPAGSPYLHARDGFDRFTIGERILGRRAGEPRMAKPLPDDLPRNAPGNRDPATA